MKNQRSEQRLLWKYVCSVTLPTFFGEGEYICLADICKPVRNSPQNVSLRLNEFIGLFCSAVAWVTR